MKEFGEFSELSEGVEEQIRNIIEMLKGLKDEDISIYYGYPIIELDGQENVMKGCIVSRKGIIGLYEIEEEGQVYFRHFMQIVFASKTLSQLQMQQVSVFQNVKLSEAKKILSILDARDLYSHEEYKEINGVIQNVYGLNKKDERNLTKEDSLGSIIKKRNNSMNMLDQNQFNGIYNKIGSHMRIRGLAGSGKTILLVKKMAYTHFKNRELDLAYVFYTKSLKQYVEQLFKIYYKDFEKYKEPDMSKIHILHSWGGNEMKGFYSEICEKNGLRCRTYGEALSLPGVDKFEAVCGEVLKTSNEDLVGIYNYIFVDEAQDFKLSFFRMAKNSLKYTGKLIYAYDELQSLNNTYSMPSKGEIFEQEPCEDINLSVCYRTPKEIIVTAHALGLGIYRKNKTGESEPVNMMEDYTIWKAVGYEVKEGQLGYGQHVVLSRKEEIEYKPDECVEIIPVEDETAQYRVIAEQIIYLVENQDVLLEDILIIDLSTLNLQDDFNEFRSVFRKMQGGNKHKVHLVNKDNAIAFRRNGSITYTSIFRAKGNEANIVFVLNAHKMSSMLSYSRNRLFTAMTRAKFKTVVLGVNSEVMETLCAEFEEVKSKNYMLDFVYPTEDVLKKMQSIAKVETEKMDTVQRVYNDVGNDTDITLEVLKEQMGAASMKDLIKELQKYLDK